MTLYLYDPRYNLKTETTYKKIESILGENESKARNYKSRKMKLNKKFYLIDDKTSKKEIKQLYSKEIIKNEVWKEIEGSEGEYLISDHGRFKRTFKNIPEGKFLLPTYVDRSKNKYTACIRVKFKGELKKYTVSRLVAYHFVDIYYIGDAITRKSKADKYRYYTYDDLVVYHKNELSYDNCASNLEWLDKEDITKKTAHKSKVKGTIVAKCAKTGEIIDYFRSTREAAKHLYISKTSVSNSLNRKQKTTVVGGTYIFEYDEE